MTGEITRTRDHGLAVAIIGSGGSGAVTAGLALLDAAAESGCYGLMCRSAGPQIRGGESAAMLRIGHRPVRSMGDRLDLLAGLDWRNLDTFADQLPLDTASRILADPAAGALPPGLAATGAGVLALGVEALAAEIHGGRANMVAVGAIGAWIGFSLAALESGVRRVFVGRGEDVTTAAVGSVRAGYQAVPRGNRIAGHAPVVAERWNLSGNEASGLGALRGGVRFAAAYPITPASELLEWLVPGLERLGGCLVQAEDELASINMAIGGSFGGVPSLTATSGPGLSLMMEGIGLAVATEIPVVVANVARCGPSTGIPTKSEQSDLAIALYGLHGDAPHLVLSPLDIRDCAFTFQWAVRLAEHLQSPAIVLSDQSLGQSRAIVDPPRQLEGVLERVKAVPGDRPYLRYAPTANGVSPMAIPGTEGCMHTAEGLEHDPRGLPSSAAYDHREQLDKRRRKLRDFDYGDDWARLSGSGRVCLVTWGSSTGAVAEAAERVTAEDRPARVVALRLIAPLRRDDLRALLADSDLVLVVEQNEGAQLFRYLHAEQSLPAHARSLARPGPLPLRPGEIVDAIHREAQHERG
jgi:2-oxoglutarate ferredoxin oxidoreductase subunit alpha